MANKEIARTLGIELATVKNHVHRVLEKLKVSRRGQAAARLRADARPKS
jgi:DNA-binding NarL/FixJ family response regulator